ncbi:MAG: hypothetical protein IAE93_15240 [Ignavibacteria bacterium]|nr:hypothetical protein [Ignavibacteria bacterium]
MLKKLAFLAAIIITCGNLYSQNTGNGWNIYTSFREVKGISLGGNSVWAASSGGLFNFDPSQPSNISKYTTLDGLSSNELTAVSYSSDGRVWAGAFNGAISVFNTNDQSWKQITDILNSTEPSKRVNAFYEYNNFMFFATEFCIVKFNIPQFQFVDQPYTRFGTLTAPTPVYDILVVNDTIWAATRNGIAFANINTNLPISSNWSSFTTTNSVMLDNQSNAMAYFNSRVYIGTDSGMVYFENGALNSYNPLFNGVPLSDPVGKMTVSGGTMYFTAYSNYEGYKGNFRTFKVNSNNLNNLELVEAGNEVNSLKVNAAGDLMLGTAVHGVSIFRNNSYSNVFPNGPASNVFQDVSIDLNGNIYGVSGGLNAGVYRYDFNNWKNFTTEDYPWMQGNDFRHVYASKYTNTVWAGGYGSGLLKMNGDSVYLYNNQNSCLVSLDGNFTLVEGIWEDNSGNTWLINRAPSNSLPIVRFNENNQCLAYPTPSNASVTTMINMAIDNFNTKWMTLPNDLPNQPRGIVYFNEGTTPNGTLINASLMGSDVSSVNHVVSEKNGEVWIGTDNGIVIVREPSQVINNPGSIPSMEKMRLIENGISTPLTENVQFIAVDELNNKWIGTLANGLLYVSPDGSTLLARYNTENSPLPVNRILSIAVSPTTGIAYFGTEKGLVALNTIAVKPLETCDKIKCGPNPFLVPSDTKLKIDGLVSESTVKIMTISGTLVSEFETPGGRIAEWDGRDLNGNFVSSGIYIIAGFNKDASQVCTGKVAVVRK